MPFKFGSTTIDVLKFNNTTLNLLKYKENASAQAVTVFRSKHKIKFAAGSGTGSMSDQTLEYDASANINENKFTKQYYTFDKWSGSNGETYSDKQSVNLKLDSGEYITLTATWKPIDYTITFNLNGGSWNSGYSAPTTYNVENHKNLPTSGNVNKTGYSFVGWFTSSDLSGSAVAKTAGNGNKTYYAKWAVVPYNIEYTLNGGSWNSGYSAPTTYNVENHKSLPSSSNITRNGYSFGGWFTSSALSGSAVAKTAGNGNKKYYAKWTPLAVYNIVSGKNIEQYGDDSGTHGKVEIGPYDFSGHNHLYIYIEYQQPTTTIGKTDIRIYLDNKEVKISNGAFWADLSPGVSNKWRLLSRINIAGYSPRNAVNIKITNDEHDHATDIKCTIKATVNTVSTSEFTTSELTSVKEVSFTG